MSNLTGTKPHDHGNATLLHDPSLCTSKTCDITLAQIEYYPTIAGNSLFLAIFILVLFVQMGFGFRHKTWSFMGTMVSGLALEILGYIGRILLHNDPFSHPSFLLELICLTIGPAFFTAAIYLCLGRIVVAYGASNSRFRPRTYTLIFCGCDLFSLVLQAIGGAIAATADTGSPGILNGTHIMVAGLAFQVFSLFLFAILCSEFAWRLRTKKDNRNEELLPLVNSKKFRLFLWALGLATLTIFVRCVFRVAELQGGFRGHLANSQVTFMILEGTMIIIAMISLSFFHPGVAFQGHWLDATFPWKKVNKIEIQPRGEKTSYPTSTVADTPESGGNGESVMPPYEA